MDNKDLEEKIAGMDLNSIYNTSPKALKELTNDFSEPLVRLLMMKAMTISGQKGLLKFIKKAYGIWQKRTKILWSEHPMVGGYPEYFDTMEANIDSDRIITTSGSVPVGSIEYYQLISQQKENKFSETDSNSIVNAAIAAVKAEIPHFEYDQQNEALSIVYGKDKGKVNLDEVVEKKTKDIVNKQLKENTCTDADIDEIFANEDGQVLGEKSSKDTDEEDEQYDEDEDTEEIEENEDDEEYEDEDNEENEDEDEVAPEVREYDTTYDYIFDPRVKPEALFNAMKGIKYHNKITERRFYYVAYRVFDAINYFSKGTSEHQYLQWINLHFNEYEDRWIDDHDHIYLFRFKLDGTAKKLKVHPSKWNSIKMYSDLAAIHYKLANDLKNTFTFVEDDNGDELKDSESYEHLKDYPQYLSGAQWIVDKYLVPDDAYVNKGRQSHIK